MMARLHCARRECYALDRVSPTLRPGRVTLARPALFSKSHQRSSPPLIRPTDVGYLRLILLSNGTRRWAFGLRHPCLRPKPASNIRVLAAWTRDLASANKRGINTVRKIRTPIFLSKMLHSQNAKDGCPSFYSFAPPRYIPPSQSRRYRPLPHTRHPINISITTTPGSQTQ